MAVFLNGATAIDKKTHWFGGPDLAIEIISPRDRSRKKLDFYSSVGTKELLFVDRNPWSLELYRRTERELNLVGQSNLETDQELITETTPLVWQIQPGIDRPMIEIRLPDGSHRWQA